MHLHSLLWAGLALAGLGWLVAPSDRQLPAADAAPATPMAPAAPPAANGHYALVVAGDRDQLAITHAVWKADPWAGVPKGLTSDWRLLVLDAKGEELANVPLDLSPFDLRPEAKGSAVRSTGCTVLDARVAMLVNVPCHAEEAAAYVFRRGADEVGRTTGAEIVRLAGGGR